MARRPIFSLPWTLFRLLALSLAWSPAAVLAQAMPQGLDPFIAAYAQAHDFNGTILVETGGKIRYERSFGLANLPFKVANTPQTKYRIASITKTFTAVLILQLQEAGRLDLDGVIGQYLPEYRGEAADKVTVQQLLNHTSGLENFDQVGSMEAALAGGLPAYQTPYTSDQLVQKFCSGKLIHTPGTVFEYNNGDYILLGKIVEKMYAKPFEQVLAERLLVPLGMADTGMLRHSDIVEGLADSYFYRDDLKTLSNDLPVYPENWYAAGAMYSTVRDLAKFSDALFAGRLLQPTTLALMTRPGLDDYGDGLWVYETKINGRKHRVAKRPGRIMGAQTQLYRFLDDDTTILLLSNAGRADTDEFVAEIGKRVVR